MMPEAGATTRSTCCYCGVGCGVLLTRERNGALKVSGDPDHPVNKGMLCSKGLNLHYTVNDQQDRLLFPQLRYSKYTPLVRATWEESLTRVARVFTSLISRFGPDSIAIYASGQCLTEEYYVLNKLMKGFIGSNNIDTNSRLCMSSAVSAYKLALGEDLVPVDFDDIDSADCIFVAGANPAWCHPILWRRVEAAKRLRPELKVIVADPRRTASCELADLHLQLKPGTDITLNHAVGRLLIEHNQVDPVFIEANTEGFDAYKELVFTRTTEESAEICGLEAAKIRELARLIGNATGFISMWAMGLNQSAVAVSKNLSLINLHLITGQVGKKGAGPMSLTGQPNAMGGRETGGLANLLPAHRDLNNPVHREEVRQFWGGKVIGEKPGLTATEIIEALEDDRLKAIWIIGTNPLVSLPDSRRAEQALKKARFVVVQDISRNAASVPFADVVFPAAGWAEKTGTMTNSERRISLLEKAVQAPGEALPDTEIICRLAQKMGFPGFDYAGPAAIYAEHCRLTAGTHLDISGLSHTSLKQGTVQWPLSKAADGQNIRLFGDQKFFTPSGRARIQAVPDANTSKAPDPDFPFILTTGRIRDQWHTMTKTGKVNKLRQHAPESFLEIHPDDAASLELGEDELIVITSGNGEVRVKARLTTSVRKGLVFLPMHWGKIAGDDLQRANNLTSDLIDPISKEPDFKFTAVNLKKYVKAHQRIVLIGAGAATFSFITEYRKRNTLDEIIVFSREKDIFYNRVMLPDYISGHQSWQNLQKLSFAEEEALNIKVHRGLNIEYIDRGKKVVLDSNGVKTHYDLLVLATGSRANRPREIPSIPGIFTMRTRTDAEEFKALIKPDSRVAIVGGGLLGLEMAAALREINVPVTLIHRVSRFMNRQLDATGSQMLHEEIIEQGCEVFLDDEVQVYYGRGQLKGLGLKSGRRVDCTLLIVAVGTIPNIDLARHAGLECKRGIPVNTRLQTADPSIFAIGEVAEFEGALYGTTAAAGQQAEIAARFISGDIAACYSGSLLMNIIKIHGFDLCSMGITDTNDRAGYEEILFIDRAKRSYKKCVIYGDRLVGAILIGDKAEFTEFKRLITERTELSEKRLSLLRSSGRTEPVLGKVVCSCNQVGTGNIELLISQGVTSLDAIYSSSGAGSGCGSCKPEVSRLLEKIVQKQVKIFTQQILS